MKTQHTPTPYRIQNHWICDESGLVTIAILPRSGMPNRETGELLDPVTANFVLRACNCHEELLEACKGALKEMQAFRAYWTGPNMNLARSKAKAEELCEAAIAKAQE